MKIKSNTIKRIIALGNSGITATTVSEATGVSVHTVLRYFRTAGVSVRGRGRPSKAKSGTYQSAYNVGYRAGFRMGQTNAVQSLRQSLKTGT